MAVANPHLPDERFSRTVLALQGLYVLAIFAWCVAKRIQPSFTLMVLVVVSVFVWRARYRAFLRHMFPFALLLASYRMLRDIAASLSPSSIHVTDLITVERALFGGVIPAAWVQQRLLDTSWAPALDLIANAFYFSHFLAPVAVAAVLWQLRREAYTRFMVGFVALSYAGFVSYVLFPAAPPWWASHYGYLRDQPVTLAPFYFSMEAVLASPNPVAAMPSLHAAYPIYVALHLIREFGRRAAWVLALPAGVAFATVYLGHHYVVDLLAGGVYAAAFFSASVALSERWSRLAGAVLPARWLDVRPDPAASRRAPAAGDCVPQGSNR